MVDLSTLTYYHWHDITLFCVYLTFNCCILYILKLSFNQLHVAKTHKLHSLEAVFSGTIAVNMLLFFRTLLLMFTSADYYYFQNTTLKYYLAHYGNFTMYVLTLSAWLRFFFKLFRFLHLKGTL